MKILRKLWCWAFGHDVSHQLGIAGPSYRKCLRCPWYEVMPEDPIRRAVKMAEALEDHEESRRGRLRILPRSDPAR